MDDPRSPGIWSYRLDGLRYGIVSVHPYRCSAVAESCSIIWIWAVFSEGLPAADEPLCCLGTVKLRRNPCRGQGYFFNPPAWGTGKGRRGPGYEQRRPPFAYKFQHSTLVPSCRDKSACVRPLRSHCRARGQRSGGTIETVDLHAAQVSCLLIYKFSVGAE